MDYNDKCDMALPLEQLLAPDADTRALLERIDKSKYRILGLTNAYKSVSVERHGQIAGAQCIALFAACSQGPPHPPARGFV